MADAGRLVFSGCSASQETVDTVNCKRFRRTDEKILLDRVVVPSKTLSSTNWINYCPAISQDDGTCAHAIDGLSRVTLQLGSQRRVKGESGSVSVAKTLAAATTNR